MSPMLSFKLEDAAQARLPVIISPKLDGIRCLVIAGVPVTRNLKAIRNKFIYKELRGLKLTGLDGELIVGSPTAHDCYRTTNSGVMSVDGEPDWTFWVFDDFSDRPFRDRLASAAKRIKKLGHPRVKLVPHSPDVTSAEQIEEYEQRYLLEGYEGIMGRDPNGFYKQGRSGKSDMALWKLKRFEDGEAYIVGYDEQMHNANEKTLTSGGKAKRSSHKEGLVPMGTLGALKVKDTQTGVEFDIGTGFTHAERAEIWANRDTWMGQTVKYKSLPIGVKEKPRHPVYLGPRKDL